MSTRSAESRDNSPDAPDGSPEKRISKKRKVLSCYACRNRKMKCDRVYPVCGRCQKTGRADQCTYDPRLLEDLPVNGDGHVEGGGPASFALPDHNLDGNATSAPTSSDALNWKLRVQERRLELMERKLTALDNSKNPSLVPPSHFDDFRVEDPEFSEEMMFRGKGFKTQYYGSTSPFSVMTQFVELQTFTRDALIGDGSMMRIKTDFKAFRDRRKAYVKERRLRVQGNDDDVFALLPEKTALDAQVTLYFQTWETSYRILHEPTFWKDYQAFWQRQPGEEIQAGFAAILVYIVAATKCLLNKDNNVFIGDSSSDREDALNLIEICDMWLMRQPRKSLTLRFFQLQCVSLLAKRVNCLKLKQDWVNSGDLMRLAIASGMHRNPALLSGGRISEFEKEMRRRIWVTIMELELQSSIDFGLQSSLCGLHFDTPPPSNLPDEAFAADSLQIPAERPIHHFTSASYLNLTLKTIPLRVHLLQLLSNPTTSLQYSDVLHYDSQINTLLASFPAWKDPRAAVPTALLNLQLRQFLLMLHRPYAKLAAKNQQFTYSFTACIDAGNAILSIYDDLQSKGILALNHIRGDVLRVGITLAQVTYHNCAFPDQPPFSHDQATPDNKFRNPLNLPLPPNAEVRIPQLPLNNFLATTLCTTGITLVDRARQIFENKVMRLGTGYMEYWIFSAAIGIMPATTPSNQPATSIASITNAPDDIRSRGRKAIERITSLCFRVLGLQKDPENSLATSMRSTLSASTPSETRTPMTNIVLSGGTPIGDNSLQSYIPGASGMATALEEGKALGQGAFDPLQDMQVDLSGWTFPDFWTFDMAGDF